MKDKEIASFPKDGVVTSLREKPLEQKFFIDESTKGFSWQPSGMPSVRNADAGEGDCYVPSKDRVITSL